MTNSVFRNLKTITVTDGDNNDLGKPDIINFTGDVTSEVVGGKLKLTVNTTGTGSGSSSDALPGQKGQVLVGPGLNVTNVPSLGSVISTSNAKYIDPVSSVITTITDNTDNPYVDIIQELGLSQNYKFIGGHETNGSRVFVLHDESNVFIANSTSYKFSKLALPVGVEVNHVSSFGTNVAVSTNQNVSLYGEDGVLRCVVSNTSSNESKVYASSNLVIVEVVDVGLFKIVYQGGSDYTSELVKAAPILASNFLSNNYYFLDNNKLWLYNSVTGTPLDLGGIFDSANPPIIPTYGSPEYSEVSYKIVTYNGALVVAILTKNRVVICSTSENFKYITYQNYYENSSDNFTDQYNSTYKTYVPVHYSISSTGQVSEITGPKFFDGYLTSELFNKLLNNDSDPGSELGIDINPSDFVMDPTLGLTANKAILNVTAPILVWSDPTEYTQELFNTIRWLFVGVHKSDGTNANMALFQDYSYIAVDGGGYNNTNTLGENIPSRILFGVNRNYNSDVSMSIITSDTADTLYTSKHDYSGNNVVRIRKVSDSFIIDTVRLDNLTSVSRSLYTVTGTNPLNMSVAHTKTENVTIMAFEDKVEILLSAYTGSWSSDSLRHSTKTIPGISGNYEIKTIIGVSGTIDATKVYLHNVTTDKWFTYDVVTNTVSSELSYIPTEDQIGPDQYAKEFTSKVSIKFNKTTGKDEAVIAIPSVISKVGYITNSVFNNIKSDVIDAIPVSKDTTYGVVRIGDNLNNSTGLVSAKDGILKGGLHIPFSVPSNLMLKLDGYSVLGCIGSVNSSIVNHSSTVLSSSNDFGANGTVKILHRDSSGSTVITTLPGTRGNVIMIGQEMLVSNDGSQWILDNYRYPATLSVNYNIMSASYSFYDNAMYLVEYDGTVHKYKSTIEKDESYTYSISGGSLNSVIFSYSDNNLICSALFSDFTYVEHKLRTKEIKFTINLNTQCPDLNLSSTDDLVVNFRHNGNTVLSNKSVPNVVYVINKTTGAVNRESVKGSLINDTISVMTDKLKEPVEDFDTGSPISFEVSDDIYLNIGSQVTSGYYTQDINDTIFDNIAAQKVGIASHIATGKVSVGENLNISRSGVVDAKLATYREPNSVEYDTYSYSAVMSASGIVSVYNADGSLCITHNPAESATGQVYITASESSTFNRYTSIVISDGGSPINIKTTKFIGIRTVAVQSTTDKIYVSNADFSAFTKIPNISVLHKIAATDKLLLWVDVNLDMYSSSDLGTTNNIVSSYEWGNNDDMIEMLHLGNDVYLFYFSNPTAMVYKIPGDTLEVSASEVFSADDSIVSRRSDTDNDSLYGSSKDNLRFRVKPTGEIAIFGTTNSLYYVSNSLGTTFRDATSISDFMIRSAVKRTVVGGGAATLEVGDPYELRLSGDSLYYDIPEIFKEGYLTRSLFDQLRSGGSVNDSSILNLKSYYSLPNLTPVGINKDGNLVPIMSTELEINQLVGLVINSDDTTVAKVAGDITGVFSTTVHEFGIKVSNGEGYSYVPESEFVNGGSFDSSDFTIMNMDDDQIIRHLFYPLIAKDGANHIYVTEEKSLDVSIDLQASGGPRIIGEPGRYQVTVVLMSSGGNFSVRHSINTIAAFTNNSYTLEDASFQIAPLTQSDYDDNIIIIKINRTNDASDFEGTSFCTILDTPNAVTSKDYSVAISGLHTVPSSSVTTVPIGRPFFANDKVSGITSVDNCEVSMPLGTKISNNKVLVDVQRAILNSVSSMNSSKNKFMYINNSSVLN